mmetsp:Transcript_14036/g.20499  ORF Transcript_14036/g.20499 Transcript_14036/m.20499 type:complete len:80 (-) Transcript_14036:1145-1384(-)
MHNTENQTSDAKTPASNSGGHNTTRNSSNTTRNSNNNNRHRPSNRNSNLTSMANAEHGFKGKTFPRSANLMRSARRMKN